MKPGPSHASSRVKRSTFASTPGLGNVRARLPPYLDHRTEMNGGGYRNRYSKQEPRLLLGGSPSMTNHHIANLDIRKYLDGLKLYVAVSRLNHAS